MKKIQVVSSRASNALDAFTDSVETGGAEQDFDKFWTKIKTSDRNANSVDLVAKSDLDFQGAANKSMLPFKSFEQTNDKRSEESDKKLTDLATGRRKASDHVQNDVSECKANEISPFTSDAAEKSTIRAKLLDKTERLKQNLRNLTLNKN